jgi:hypothetical protein
LNSRLAGETAEIKAGNNERNSFMGHIVGKDVLHHTTEEADLIIKMPYRLSGFDRIQKIHLIEKLKLQKLIEGMCAKGLVLDVKGV